MDDFDELLDEIEKDLTTGQKPNKKQPVALKSKSSNTLDDDIDAILRDEVGATSSITSSKHKPVSKKIPGSVKCSSLFIGGSKTPSGLSSLACKKTCDRLRCTSCDFRVEHFDDYEWHGSVDYLFFRNNMPDFKKISTKLRRKAGSRAYACQCSWKSVVNITNLRSLNMKWVCGKH